MKTLNVRAALLVAGFVGLGAAVAGEAGAAKSHAEAFDELFGDRIEDVEATDSRVDDARLANELVSYVQDLSSSPGFAYYLCSRVYELGRLHGVGYGAAIRALTHMIQMRPEEEHALAARRLQIYQMAFRTLSKQQKLNLNDKMVQLMLETAEMCEQHGEWATALDIYRDTMKHRFVGPTPFDEDVRTGLTRAEHMLSAERRIDAFKRRLDHSPDNKSAARMLARSYIVDIDEPGKALPLLEVVDDEEMKKFVPLAAGPLKDVPVQQLGELAEWYDVLSRRATGFAKANMLLRAVACYDQIDRRSDDADQRMAAKQQIKAARGDLARAGLSDRAIDRRVSQITDPEPKTTAVAVVDIAAESEDGTTGEAMASAEGHTNTSPDVGTSPDIDTRPDTGSETGTEMATNTKPDTTTSTQQTTSTKTNGAYKASPKRNNTLNDAAGDDPAADAEEDVGEAPTDLPANWRPVQREVNPEDQKSIFDF